MGKKILLVLSALMLGGLLVSGWMILITACQDNRNIDKSYAIAGKLAPEGFIFLREETFSCGGQTNTAKIFEHEKTNLEFVLLSGNDDIDPLLICRTETTQGACKRIMGIQIRSASFYETMPILKWTKLYSFREMIVTFGRASWNTS